AAGSVTRSEAGAARQQLESRLIEAVRWLAPLEVANSRAKPASPAAATGELQLVAARALLREPDPIARAVAVGREFLADRVLLVEVAPLGDDVVVYLRALDAASGHDLGSATATLPASGQLDERTR